MSIDKDTLQRLMEREAQKIRGLKSLEEYVSATEEVEYEPTREDVEAFLAFFVSSFIMYFTPDAPLHFVDHVVAEGQYTDFRNYLKQRLGLGTATAEEIYRTLKPHVKKCLEDDLYRLLAGSMIQTVLDIIRGLAWWSDLRFGTSLNESALRGLTEDGDLEMACATLPAAEPVYDPQLVARMITLFNNELCRAYRANVTGQPSTNLLGTCLVAESWNMLYAMHGASLPYPIEDEGGLNYAMIVLYVMTRALGHYQEWEENPDLQIPLNIMELPLD